MTNRPHILIIEDDAEIRSLVQGYLQKQGFRVETGDGGAALDRHLSIFGEPDLIVLDIMLPGEDGLSICRRLRATSRVPILMLTARGEDIDRIVGLEIGADDYIVKPYELREVLARVRSVLRRVPQPTEPQAARAETGNRRFMNFGGFQADFDGRLVIGANGAVIEMAKSEFDVLEVFLTRANRLLTRATISEAIGFVEDPESSRAVDIRIMRLRKKIEADPANPKFLRTVRGEGYIFSLPSGDGN